MVLWMVAKFRRFRRSTIRYAEEQQRMEEWLTLARELADQDNALATEWIGCQRLIKGYGETFERGVRNMARVKSALMALPAAARTPEWLAQACAAALADEQSDELTRFLAVA